MSIPASTARHRLLLVLALAASAGAAQARNDKLLLPIDAALRSPGTRAILGQDVTLRFGKASAAGAEIVSPAVAVHAVADPYGGGTNNNGQGGRTRRSDDQVCLDAFRKAVIELQQRARTSGAAAVVGIVSNYQGVEFDSPQVYECHVGITRAVVDLKGQSARLDAAQAGHAQPAPVQTAAAAAAERAAPPAIPMLASGFANINDIDAIPYLSDKGRDGYRDWLTKPTPKAFAISSAGHWFGAWSLTPRDTALPSDPSERALLVCSQRAQMACKLYAVNGAVVWAKETRGTTP